MTRTDISDQSRIQHNEDRIKDVEEVLDGLTRPPRYEVFDFAPTANADIVHNWRAGDIWTDRAAGTVYLCVDPAVGAAVWREATGLTGSGTPGVIPKWVGSTVLGDSIMSETGGGIAVAGNLSTTGGGNLSVSGAVSVTLTLNVDGFMEALGGANFEGLVTFGSFSNTGIDVYGTTRLRGAVTMDSTLSVTGTASLLGNATVGGTLAVTGAITGDSIAVTNGVSGATLSITGDAGIGGNLTVTGNVTGSNYTVNGNLTLSATTQLLGPAALASPDESDELLVRDVSDSNIAKLSTIGAVWQSGATGLLGSQTALADADEVLHRDVSDGNTAKVVSFLNLLSNLPPGLATDAAIALADQAVFKDSTDSLTKLITYQQFLDSFSGLSAVTAPATTDEHLFYSASATAARKMTLADLFKIVGGFSLKGTPVDGDLLVIADSEDSGNAKSLSFANLVSAVEGEIGGALATASNSLSSSSANQIDLVLGSAGTWAVWGWAAGNGRAIQGGCLYAGGAVGVQGTTDTFDDTLDGAAFSVPVAGTLRWSYTLGGSSQEWRIFAVQLSGGTTKTGQVISASTTITSDKDYVLADTSGITATLWAAPANFDYVKIDNGSGADITVSGNGVNIDGGGLPSPSASVTLSTDTVLEFIYNSTTGTWRIT